VPELPPDPEPEDVAAPLEELGPLDDPVANAPSTSSAKGGFLARQAESAQATARIGKANVHVIRSEGCMNSPDPILSAQCR
jgi:hypothetical protein